MRWLALPAAKPLVFVLCLGPLGWLVWGSVHDLLGANPAEAVIRSLGDWTLRFLVIALLITPLRVVLSLPALARLRRMLGLFVFFYASLHWLAYAWLDMGFGWQDIAADIPRRPFILVGTLAWLGLLAMAVTSFDRAIRWLGARRWQRLHRVVYGVAVLAILHFFWMRAAKNDVAEVMVYGAILAVLLGWRVRRLLGRRRSTGSRAQGS